ncbi:MAG: hypothetical protein AAGG38_06525 [Planctomycetota bacterium]
MRPLPDLADQGDDAEHHHVRCRQARGLRRTAIPIHPRSAGRKGPKPATAGG